MNGKTRGTILAATGALALACSSLGSAADYAHEVQAQKISFAWTVNGDRLDVKLNAPTTGWVGIGFNPTEGMQGGNYILGYVKDGKVTLSDDFGDSSNNHKADDKLGGTEDATLVGGVEEKGSTTIEFSIPLDSADANDGKIDVNTDTVVLLAYGPDRDSFRVRHKYRTELKVNLSTGSSGK